LDTVEMDVSVDGIREKKEESDELDELERLRES
jgi:hypothetical protein